MGGDDDGGIFFLGVDMASGMDFFPFTSNSGSTSSFGSTLSQERFSGETGVSSTASHPEAPPPPVKLESSNFIPISFPPPRSEAESAVVDASANAQQQQQQHHQYIYEEVYDSAEASAPQKAVAFLAGPREKIVVLGPAVERCPRCLADGHQVNWRPHRHLGELKVRYICERNLGDLDSNHHFDVPLCPLCNTVLYLYEYNSMLGLSNARRLHKYVLKCASRHVLPVLDLFCQTKKGGDRCNANFKLQWCYGTMVKRCEAQKNRDHDLWWVRYKNEWKQRRTIIRYKKDFLSRLSDSQRGLLLGLGVEGEPPPDPKTVLGATFDTLVASAGQQANVAAAVAAQAAASSTPKRRLSAFNGEDNVCDLSVRIKHESSSTTIGSSTIEAASSDSIQLTPGSSEGGGGGASYIYSDNTHNNNHHQHEVEEAVLISSEHPMDATSILRQQSITYRVIVGTPTTMLGCNGPPVVTVSVMGRQLSDDEVALLLNTANGGTTPIMLPSDEEDDDERVVNSPSGSLAENLTENLSENDMVNSLLDTPSHPRKRRRSDSFLSRVTTVFAEYNNEGLLPDAITALKDSIKLHIDRQQQSGLLALER